MRQQKFGFLFSFVVLLGLFCFPPKVLALTVVDADIVSNTTWTESQSPYVVSLPITVGPDATLTIEPGVAVKFDYGASLFIDGVLNASGTQNKPIYFTSYYDDSVGGDTNGDGSDSFPYVGDWSNIVVNSTAAPSVLDHVFIRYSNGGLFLYNGGSVNSDALESDKEILAIGSHSTFTNLTVPHLEIFGSSVLDVDKANITNPDMTAINVYGNSSLTLKNSTVQGSGGSPIVNIYQDSTATFDSVKMVGDLISDGAWVFSGGSVHFSKSTIAGVNNGLYIYSNSSLTADDFSLACASDGISVYDNSTFNFSKGSVACGHDGMLFFGDAKAAIDGVKVSGATDAGVLVFNNTQPNPVAITKSEIIGNEYGFVVFNTGISVHQNSIHGNNTNGALAFEPLTPNTFDFTSNYWGDSTGPQHASNPAGLGDVVSDDVLFTPFLASDPLAPKKVPVLIVPGILGTEINQGTIKLWLDLSHNLRDIGDQFMDSLQFNTNLTPSDISLALGDVVGKISFLSHSFDYSDGLAKEFENQGYEQGTNLFLFPYDWRYGANDNIVNQLKQKIQDIKTQTGSSKVDIVAHSTGGLLVKKYIMDNPLSNNIGKAVFVGVPNIGAPKAIKALIQGDNFGNYFVADNEMKKIAQNLPVSYDLLPSQQYYSANGSYMGVTDQNGFTYTSKDINFDDMNTFLTADHGLNAQALIDAHNLHTTEFDNYDMRTAGVDLYSINGCKTGTIGKIKEVRYHGLLGGVTYSYNAPEEVPGDGTVPLASAASIAIDQAKKYYALKAEHGSMLSKDGIRQEIVKLITGNDMHVDTDLVTQDVSQCKLNGKVVSIYSPLNIDVTDQDGNHSGLVSDGSIENTIPNADFEIMGEHKFVYLPDGSGQVYNISVKGTGSGTFTLKNDNVVDNEITSAEEFKDVPVTTALKGSVQLGDTTTLTLDANGDGQTDDILMPDNVTPSLDQLIQVVTQKVQLLPITDKLKQNLLKKIANLQDKIEKKKAKNVKILTNLNNKISKQAMKGKIDAANADQITALLDQLEAESDGIALDADILNELVTRIQALNVKDNVKASLVKRVTALQNKRSLITSLTNLTQTITKKVQKGKIPDADAQAIIDLINQITAMI